MTLIKNGCKWCKSDYYTTTEQCDNPDCGFTRRTKEDFEVK